MTQKFKRFFLRLYFMFYASRVFARIFMPIRLSLEKFLPYQISFSQFGEDQYFKKFETKQGTYVEIGCNHPVLASNSFRLYLKGWTGLVVDGNALYKKFWNTARPKDIFINTLISANNKKEMPFYEHYAGFVSTGVKDHADQFNSEDFTLTYKDTKSINEVLAANHIHSIDVLFLDIEGMDYEVLSSLDLALYKPKYICIEDHEYPTTGNKSLSVISKYLNQNDYFLDSMLSPSFIYKQSNAHVI